MSKNDIFSVADVNMAAHADFIAEEHDFWNGPGKITFYVEQNTPDVFEISILDYTGCAQGLEDTIGIEYHLTDIWDFQKDLREGVTYTINDLAVTWTRGEWGFTDDDVDYDFSTLTSNFKPIAYLNQKLSNLWWRQVTCRIREWKLSK